MAVMKFQFNTGRLYTAQGQPIRVRYDPVTGEALFADEGRFIDGEAQLAKGLASKWDVEMRVLKAYDNFEHKHSKRSLDFLLRGTTFEEDHPE
jgi:hypothetical protein